MKRILLITLLVISSIAYSFGQIFMTELADPKDKTGARYSELFNAGTNAVDLAAEGAKYGFLRYTNGNAEPQQTIYYLEGTIAAKNCFVVAVNGTVFQETYGFAPNQNMLDTYSDPSASSVNSNGDDQTLLVIVSATDTITVDVFGVPGEDGTGTCHGYEDGRAERVASSTTGNAGTWNEANWNVLGSNEASCTNHITQTVSTTDGIFDPGIWIGYTPSNTIVAFETVNSEVTEDGVSIDICVSIENASANNATTVDIEIAQEGTATNGSDFSGINTPYTLSFAAGSNENQCFTISIADDDELELTEQIILTLTNATGGLNAEIGAQANHAVEIIDNDLLSLPEGALVITEVMQNPQAVSDASGEWFEVYNTTDADINLFGIKFRDDNGLNEFFVVDSNLIISARDYVVFACNGNKALNGGVDADFVYPDEPLLTLANSTDGIVIISGSTVVDSIQWDNGATFPDPNGASMALKYEYYNSVDNVNGENWEESTLIFGDGDLGTPGYGMPATIPATPELTLNATVTEIKLAWTDVDDEAGYKIFRSVNSNSYIELLDTVANISSYVDSDVENNLTYSYFIFAYNFKGNSTHSDTLSTQLYIPETLPVATNLELTATKEEVNLSWFDLDNELGYYIYKSIDNEEFNVLDTLDANTTTFTDTEVVVDAVYDYYVVAFNSVGEGKKSKTVHAELLSEGTVLAPGDIIITGVFTDNPDVFSFVLLREIEAGTEITFTDKGWDSANNSFITGGEGFTFFTALHDYPAGKLITFERGDNYADQTFGPEFTFTNEQGFSQFALSAAGDQCIAFQGDTLNPDRFIFAVTTNSSVWQTSMNPAENLNAGGAEVAIWRMSNVPTGLEEGKTAIAIGQSTFADDEYDNVWYTGITNGTKQAILESCANVKNWKGDMTAYNAYTNDFVIAGTFVNKVAAASARVFPNPASETVTIEALSAIHQVDIYAYSGALVYSKEGLTNTVSININDLKPGIYLLQIHSASGISFEKFIKQ